MKNYQSTIKVILIAISLYTINAQVGWNCTYQEAAQAFKQKVLLQPMQNYTQDPYLNVTNQEMQIINQTLNDKALVCAIQYQDSEKITYIIQQFQSQQDAENANFIVTHQGKCGSCSTLQDLSAYLATNMTKPVRLCGVKGFFSKKWGMKCLQNLGFTYPCSQIWFYNTINTRKECGLTCMWSWVTHRPYVKPDGNLNNCLQCDEDKSGPVFKYYSGRTRRDSGITSEIDRPNDQIYNMTQCYY